MRIFPKILAILLLACLAGAQQNEPPKPAAQNPSPMVESARAHERIPQQQHAGIQFKILDILPRPVEVFVPQARLKAHTFELLLHFHGAGFVMQHAAVQYKDAIVAATVNIGSGSGVYGKAFEDSTKFQTLLEAIKDSLQHKLARPVAWRRISLSGFSAGYGAIRKIISTPQHCERVAAILLLDGIHASYIPDRQVLAEGGKIDSSGLMAFVWFAGEAAKKNSGKRFLITHSEIFPGTFVSTTEATDFILEKLGMQRQPVLIWGPLGMQQLSRARRHHFEVRGFAGNTAPDHVDHLHGLPRFLSEMMKL